jgi:hypothetical protein
MKKGTHYFLYVGLALLLGVMLNRGSGTRVSYAAPSAQTAANVALGKPASQSSTFTADYPASRAVDGNTDGNDWNRSINHTNSEVNPWWQVDLGSTTAINTITLWNRTDCCSDRLTNFFVFVANYDMTGKGFGDLVVDNTVWRYSLGTTAPTTLNIPVNTTGRYVRVQLAGANYLHLAEVQVFGSSTTKSSTVTTDFENGTLGMFTSSRGAGITTNAYNSQKAAIAYNTGDIVAAHGTLTPGVRVTVSAWVKGIGTPYLSFARSNFTEIANVYRAVNSNTWQQVTLTGLAPTNTTYYDLVFRADNGAFLVDHVTWTTEEPNNLDGVYLLKAVHSGKCMEVAGESTVNGGNVQQWSCEPNARHHQWKFTAVGNGYYKIINVNSGKGLDVAGISTADGANLHQWDYLNGNNQKWRPVPQSDGTYQLVALHSNKCGTVTNAATADGAGIAQYTCGMGANQRFKLELLAETIVTNFEDNSLGIFTSGNGSSLTNDAESGQKAAIAPATGNTVSTRNAISPQTPITVIAWVKGIGTAYVSFARSNFTEISNSYRAVNSPTWQQITFAATAPIGTVAYDLVFRADNGAFLVDNIVVILNERDTDNDSLSDRVESCSNLGSLNYEFYDISVAGYNLNNLPTTGALAKGVTADFDVQRLQTQFTPTDPHHYGLRYSGYLWITEAGQYTFFTNSDDGSLVSLDYRLVVNNDGSHPLTERSGTVSLYAGLHRFQLLYSAYTTPNSLAVQWSGPSFSKTTLPFNRLLSCDPNTDTDQDGIPNVRDLDSDDDTIPDAVENSR